MVACQIPTQSVHRTTHTALIRPKPRAHSLATVRRPGRDGLAAVVAPRVFWLSGTTAPHHRRALTRLEVGLRVVVGQSCRTVAQPPNFAQTDWICRAELQWVECGPPAQVNWEVSVCSLLAAAQHQHRTELAPTKPAHRPPPHHRARQTTTSQSRRKKDLDLRPSSTTTQPTRPPTTPNRQRRISFDDTCPSISSIRFTTFRPACLTTERSRSRPSLATRSCPRTSSRRLAASSCSTSGPTRMLRSATSP